MSTPAVMAMLTHAVELHRAGRLADAAAAYEQVLAAEPRQADALNLRGVIAEAQGDLAGALSWYGRAIAAKPKAAEFHFNQGNALAAQDNSDAALAAYGRAVDLRPEYAEAHLNRGVLLHKLGRRTEAADAFRQVMRLAPQDARGPYNLGRCLTEEGDTSAAIVALRQAIHIKPAYIEARLALATAHAEAGQLDEARALAQATANANPQHAEAQNDLGTYLGHMGDWHGALDLYDRAIALDPAYPSPHINRGLARLTLGDLAEGWDGYARRFDDPRAPFRMLPRPWPRWQGEELRGKNILIWGEQGIGDHILYGSMILDAAAEARHCTFECEPRLVPLFARSFPHVDVVPLEQTATPTLLSKSFDTQTSVLDLGRRYRRQFSQFPNRSAFLSADPKATEDLRAEYRRRSGGKPIVGISWRSTSRYTAASKSVALTEWAPLFQGLRATFVNLQYGATDRDAADIKDRYGADIFTDPTVDALIDMDRFAAQLAAMDVIVSVSNTTVHLAGALGVPTYVLVPQGKGNLWYWFAKGDWCPWYSSLQLFRRGPGQSWLNVVAAITDGMSARMAASCG